VIFTFFIASPFTLFFAAVAIPGVNGGNPDLLYSSFALRIELREFIAEIAMRRTPGNPPHRRINPQILWISLCTSSPRTRKPAIRKRFSYPLKE
jgi:hypothetical protein